MSSPAFSTAIVRRICFCASYRYWRSDWSEAKNRDRFGSEARSPGACYDVRVAVAGPVGRDGMVANLSSTVKRVLQREVVQPLDGAFLNDAWPEFAETLPTPEAIARAIWHRAAAAFGPRLAIASVRVGRGPDLEADYRGGGMEAYLTVRAEFCAAHRLALPELSEAENYEIYGKCARPNGHGHNYKLAVTVRGDLDPRTGMVVNFSDLKRVVKAIAVEELDHTFLNRDVPHFAEVVPTAENIAAYLRDRLREPIAELGAALYRIDLDETDNNACTLYATTGTGEELAAASTHNRCLETQALSG